MRWRRGWARGTQGSSYHTYMHRQIIPEKNATQTAPKLIMLPHDYPDYPIPCPFHLHSNHLNQSISIKSWPVCPSFFLQILQLHAQDSLQLPPKVRTLPAVPAKTATLRVVAISNLPQGKIGLFCLGKSWEFPKEHGKIAGKLLEMMWKIGENWGKIQGENPGLTSQRVKHQWASHKNYEPLLPQTPACCPGIWLGPETGLTWSPISMGSHILSHAHIMFGFIPPDFG